MKYKNKLAFISALILIMCSCSVHYVGTDNLQMPDVLTETVYVTSAADVMQYQSVAYECEIVSTADWVNFAAYHIGGSIGTVNMELPQNWEYNNGKAYDKSGGIAFEIKGIVKLLSGQTMLDTYGTKGRDRLSGEFARCTVPLENFSAGLILAKSGGRYSYNYFVLSGDVVIYTVFYADNDSADTKVFEHCVNSISVSAEIPETEAPSGNG